jgi:hypothetical protein
VVGVVDVDVVNEVGPVAGDRPRHSRHRSMISL